MFLYAGDVVLALVRGARDGAYLSLTSAIGKGILYFATVLLGLTAVACARDRDQRDRRLAAIVYSPAVYAVVNLVLAEAGVQNAQPAGATAGTQDQLLGALGVGGGRTVYPLATSINLYSIVASSAVAGLVVLRLRRPDLIRRRYAWPAILVCLYEVVAGDSRATLVWAALIIALFAVRRRYRGSPWLAWAVPFFPLIVTGLLNLVADSGIANALNRSSGGQSNFESFATGTGRVYIWKGAWQVLRHFQLQDVVGWGAAGQIPSGASLHYAFVFPNEPLAYTVFTHSAPLQAILDEGYLGLLLLVLVLWQTFRLLNRLLALEPRSPASALVAMLMVILLSGATEVSPSYYAEEVLMLVFLIGSAAAATRMWAPVAAIVAPARLPATGLSPRPDRGPIGAPVARGA